MPQACFDASRLTRTYAPNNRTRPHYASGVDQPQACALAWKSGPYLEAGVLAGTRDALEKWAETGAARATTKAKSKKKKR
jgi:hypothetical protein